MTTQPSSQFVPRRIKVCIRPEGSPTPVSCVTQEISNDHVFIQGGPRLRGGCTVELTFNRRNGDPVSVNCVVVPHSGERLLLCYGQVPANERAHLHTALWPDWDGRDLLDGLILMADRCEQQTLAEWLRLTSLLCRLQNHRSRLGGAANAAERRAAA